MDFLAHVAELAREHELNLGVDILDILLNGELAVLAELVDVAELGEKLLQFVFLKEPDALEHGDVRHGAENVVFGEIHVHLAVAAHGEPLYLLVDLKVFFPKFVGHKFVCGFFSVFYHLQRVGNLLYALLQRLLHH